MLGAGIKMKHVRKPAVHNISVTAACKITISYTVDSFLLTWRGEQEYSHLSNQLKVSSKNFTPIIS